MDMFNAKFRFLLLLCVLDVAVVFVIIVVVVCCVYGGVGGGGGWGLIEVSNEYLFITRISFKMADEIPRHFAALKC